MSRRGSFIAGFLTAIGLVLVFAVVVLPQYADYRAASQVSQWLLQVRPAQELVAENAKKNGGLTRAGVGVREPDFSPVKPDFFAVTESGAIIIRGGHEGQAVVLLPEFASGALTWRCVGGSRGAVPASCKKS